MREPKVGTNANKAVRESKKAVRPMIGHSSLGKSESGYSPEPMLERECLGDGSGKSKMPPEWVVEQFEQLLRSVFRVILALVTNNKKCSEQLMRQAKFFNRLLELYPGEVGRIIQETIKNLSLLTTQAVRQENDSLFQWTKLIACVTTESVQIQKNYIDIIA